jgi:hypothetical protein
MSDLQQEPAAPVEKVPVTTKDPTAPSAQLWRDPVLWAILLLASFLILCSLGDRCLWQDEAETVLLAQGILRSGLPIARNGDNVVSQLQGEEYGPDFVWRWSPWMQNYLAAGSMRLLGQTTFAARLPFAVLGILSVALTYVLARRLFGPPAIARLSALLLVLSVPFLLHVRQARWYAPAYVLVALLFLFLLRIANRQRFGIAGFVVTAVLFFHTNYFIAIGLLGAVAVAALLCRPHKAFVARLSLAYAFCFLLTLPAALYFDVLGKPHRFTVKNAWDLLQVYTGYFATYLLPIPALAVLLLLLVQRGPVSGLHSGWKRNVCLLLIVCGLYPVYLCVAPWGIFRYLSVLFPLAAILAAVVLYWIMSLSVRVGVLILVVLLATDVVHRLPLGYLHAPATAYADKSASLGTVNFPLYGYLYEISHHVDDPEWVVAQYLLQHAAPHDVVLASYGDLPLQFYTGLRVVGGLQGQPLPVEPDWIFLHYFFVSEDDEAVVRFFTEQIDHRRYQLVPLHGNDCKFGNNPDPTYHFYRIPNDRSIYFFHKESG